MNCERVLSRLSEYLDEVLDGKRTVQVKQHLAECAKCRREFERLALLRRKLSSLGTVHAPDYLQHLVQLRLHNEEENTLRVRLRDALERRWSIIRSTEGIWYLTRILGTVMTSVFFVMIVASLNPAYFDQTSDRGPLPPAYRQQLPLSVLGKLGLLPVEAQRRPISPSEPMINDLYLLNFGQSLSREGQDDTLSVVAVVDRSGTAKIQNVLEYPADRALLNSFNSMLTNARCRPASQNGHAVDSHLVLTFSKVSVYD
ncbi:MAG TPA: zf-HC2 domain-containing protein [Acidobacteriota bacterium]|nr:zf-HC2 domain-containing protein [Acidobacteriota bacterium]